MKVKRSREKIILQYQILTILIFPFSLSSGLFLISYSELSEKREKFWKKPNSHYFPFGKKSFRIYSRYFLNWENLKAERIEIPFDLWFIKLIRVAPVSTSIAPEFNILFFQEPIKNSKKNNIKLFIYYRM